MPLRQWSERAARGSDAPSSGANDWLGRSTTPNRPDSALVNEAEARLILTLTGWRRRCLFGLLLVLTVIVIINLSLTLWLMRSMQFSLDGIGNMKITPNGIQLNGEAMVLDTLLTSQISSKPGRSLTIDSSRNITLTARDDQGRIANKLFLGDDSLEVLARDFRVMNANGETLFAANRREVVVGADILRVSGVGGAVFEGSVQTPIVRAEAGHDLKLESPTRTLQMQAPLGITIESQAGDIAATCYEDLRLKSTGGTVRIDSPSIVLANLRTAVVTVKPKLPLQQQSANPTRSTVQVFQVCVCSNGRLFLSSPDGACVADPTICV